MPDLLSWSFTDQFGQARRNEFLPDAPDNRQNINNFSTGPTLFMPFGRRVQVNASATYSIRDFEDAARFDSKSIDFQLGLLAFADANRVIWASSAVSRSIEYDNVINSEFDINSYFLTYNARVGGWQL